MTPAELKALKTGDGKDWAWLVMDYDELGQVEVAGEFTPAERDGYRLIPAEFDLMAVHVPTTYGAADLTLFLDDSTKAAMADRARDQLERLCRVAHYQAMADAAHASCSFGA